MTRRGWSWVIMGVVAMVALAVGLTRDDTARTTDDRLFALAETVRCPTCAGQSVAESEAPIAKEIRATMARRIEAGQSDDEIRDFLVSRWGEEVLLTPSASGLTGLVWVLPVVVTAGAVTALVLTFRRWRAEGSQQATRADYATVEAARSPAPADDPS